MLAGTVIPTNATNNTIVWSLDDACGTGATVSGSGVFRATAPGIAMVKAKVINGLGAGIDYEETFAVTVTAAPTPPAITDPVQSQTVTAAVGSPVTLSVTASNAAGYQWQINRGSGWSDIPGANAASYTTSAVTAANSGYQYRCIVRGAVGTTDATSPVFTLSVTDLDIPATGDSSMPLLWIGLMLLAGMGLMASAVLGRRKRHNN